VNADLSPSRHTLEIVQEVGNMLVLFHQSSQPVASKQQEFTFAFNAILSALMESIRLSSSLGVSSNTKNSSISQSGVQLDAATDVAVSKINILTALQSVLQQFEFASSNAATLNLLLQQQIETVVTSQASAILAKCKLDLVLNSVKQWKDAISKQHSHSSTSSPSTGAGAGAEPRQGAGGEVSSTTQTSDVGSNNNTKLCDMPNMQSEFLNTALTGFYNSMYSLGAFVMPQSDRIIHAHIRKACRQAITRLVASYYNTLYTAVHDPASGFATPSIAAMFVHTPEHLNTLLELNPNRSKRNTPSVTPTASNRGSPQSSTRRLVQPQ
jgi:hypothetical protein